MKKVERPRYVPGRHRRKQNERFHGAFTGGFSAGFYNTVGSKEGWTPKEEQAVDESHNDDDNTPSSFRKRPQQSITDFMDEADHAEWGGPVAVRRDYEKDALRPNSAESTIKSLMKVTVEPRANVGHRLLRVLGWREGNSSAYVPTKGDPLANHGSSLPEANLFLSSKRMRKIQLQQERVKIPPPKLDSVGLGYEQYENAPEFKAYREKRRKQAQQRAQLGQHTREVYRVSNVLGSEGDEERHDIDGSQRKSQQSSHNHDTDDAYASYETVEDFVGSKSVGGFALREDEDDAYDDNPLSLSKVSGKLKLDQEEYHNEIIDHHSSDEEGHQHTFRGGATRKGGVPAASATNGADLAGILTSFAEIDSSTGASSGGEKLKTGGVTADGRPPLAGFVLGGAFTSHCMPKRYRGPDVPLSYEVKRHEFGPNENPMVLQALSRAVQLEMVDEKRKQALDEALRQNALSNAPSRFRGQARNSIASSEPAQRSNAPMAGGTFAGLAEAMKNRFTSVVDKGSDGKKPEAGLRIPTKGSSSTDQNDTTNKTGEAKKQAAPKEVKIRRTVFPFAPHRLLCKRFHVSVPAASMHATTVPSGGERRTEASYFKEQILSTAAAAAGRDKPQDQAQPKSESPKKKVLGLKSIFNEDGTMKVYAIQEKNSEPVKDRPSKEIYKSIFEPESDEGADSDLDEAEKADVPAEAVSKRDEATNAARIELEPSNMKVDMDSPTRREHADTDKREGESALVCHDGREKRKKKRKKGKKRSRFDSEDDDDDSDSRGHRRRRKARSRSISSESSNLSRDSTDHRREKKRRRDRKENKHKRKKKKSKRR